MAPRYTHTFSAITSGSTSTSPWWFVGDYDAVSVSWQSSASLGPSRFTLEGSNMPGSGTGLPGNTSAANASLMTGVNILGRASGITSLQLGGVMWMRATVDPASHSAASVTSIIFGGRA